LVYPADEVHVTMTGSYDDFGCRSSRPTHPDLASALPTPTLLVLGPTVHPSALDLDNAVQIIQDYTKKWPEQLRHSQNEHIAASDTDRGFERLLREALQNALPIGHTSHIRDLGMGDGRAPAIVPQHELDIILQCQQGRFVVEAKAWEGEVGKEDVIIFLAKTLDFMAARSFDPVGPIILGFIGLSGFTEAAQRVMFAFGVIPFTKRAEQLSFRFVDELLRRAERKCKELGVHAHESALNEQRAGLTPFLHQEGKDLSITFQFDTDAAVVDVDGIRQASDMFGEARAAHQHAMKCYREAKKAFEVDRG